MDKDVADTFMHMMVAFDQIESTFRIFAEEGEKDRRKVQVLEDKIEQLERRLSKVEPDDDD